MKKLLVLLLVLLTPLTALAEEIALTLLDMPEENQQRFLKNVALVAWEEEDADRPIVCFDVRADGMTALGFNRPRGGKYVAVINQEGEFQYGYVFQCTGSFLVEWTEDGLGIIWIRSDVFAVFDEQGQPVRICEIKTDSASNRHMNQLRETSRSMEAYDFTLQAGRLIRTDSQGQTVILHDAFRAFVLQWVEIAAVILLVTICIVVRMRKRASEPRRL